MYPNREGIRGEMKKKGINPRNHHLDNIRMIKGIQQGNRIIKHLEEEKKKQPKFRMKQFQNVESRVFKDKPTPKSEPSNNGKQTRVTKTKYRKNGEKDYVRNNRTSARNSTQKKKVTKKHKRLPGEETYQYGEVPSYLKKRKEKWAEEEELKREAKRKRRMPQGMVVMPELERLNTLETLNKKKNELEVNLRKMPVICDTVGLRRKRKEMEDKIDEIENALKIFSKKKVFISEN